MSEDLPSTEHILTNLEDLPIRELLAIAGAALLQIKERGFRAALSYSPLRIDLYTTKARCYGTATFRPRQPMAWIPTPPKDPDQTLPLTFPDPPA